MTVEQRPGIRFLSELYADDVSTASLLAEYPSSNSQETRFQNRSEYIIHDPYPPPPPELLKQLGPHHLMYCWGRSLAVASEVPPPPALLKHWENALGNGSRPKWEPFDAGNDYITLFPHESLPAERQVIDPNVNYAIHSKEVIQKIDCPQAEVRSSVQPPCLVKLTHGYAGLGNFHVRSLADEKQMRRQLAEHWPDAKLVINSVIQDIAGDFGVQFYLKRDGTMIWLGFTEQHFDERLKWSGGSFSADLQSQLFHEFATIIEPVGEYLHNVGYFGVVGIDILRDTSGGLFLVDVNPRLTGISPFLMASRIFAQDGMVNGVYRASCRYLGSITKLLEAAERVQNARVVVLSAVETPNGNTTICHLSAHSDSDRLNQESLDILVSSAT